MTLTQYVVAGVRTPVEEAGDATADEAVVFVHGNPGSAQDWTALLSGAGKFARAVAPDMPGFGRAEKPWRFPYTVEGYADHLHALLDTLGIRRAHLVLHDFGGPWGIEWAARHPASVGSLTFVNTGVLIGFRWHRLARLWRTPILGELFQLTTSRPALRFLINHDNGRPLPDAFIDRMYDHFDWPTRRAVLKLYRATGDVVGLGARHAAALRQLDVPSLLVFGEDDPYIPASVAQRQREALPGIDIQILPGLGHWPFIEDHDAVARPVLSFLRRAVG